ncbi:hypothetical protein KI387_005971, partial [Taxus chinensis]
AVRRLNWAEKEQKARLELGKLRPKLRSYTPFDRSGEKGTTRTFDWTLEQEVA